MDSNTGWNRYIGSDPYYKLALAGWPGWDKAEDGEPYHVNLTIIRGTDKDSLKWAYELDDLCQMRFWWRDFTSDGIPIVREGETYRSIFVFQSKQDYEKFRELLG